MMHDSKYFRDRAKRCLQLARQVRDTKAAESFRERAAGYTAYADSLAEMTVPPSSFVERQDPKSTPADAPAPTRNPGPITRLFSNRAKK